MTTAAEIALRTDLRAPDHFPTCPRCGDLCRHDAIVCPECGVKLFEGNAQPATGSRRGL